MGKGSAQSIMGGDRGLCLETPTVIGEGLATWGWVLEASLQLPCRPDPSSSPLRDLGGQDTYTPRESNPKDFPK